MYGSSLISLTVASENTRLIYPLIYDYLLPDYEYLLRYQEKRISDYNQVAGLSDMIDHISLPRLFVCIITVTSHIDM